jgi:DNA-binding NtrC family response regulator
MSFSLPKVPVVLIVEDDVLIRMDAADLLLEAGYRVITQASADHALAVLTVRSDVDVLLTNINMAGSLTGSALARIVDRRWPGLPVIATSGAGEPAPGELPDTAWFLPKPYQPSALLEAVRTALASAAPASIEIPRATGISSRSERA